MEPIKHNNPVVIPMNVFVGGVCAIVVAFFLAGWSLLSFGLSGIRDDVSAIRTDVGTVRGDVTSMQKSETAIYAKIGDMQTAFEKDVSDLRGDVATARGEFRSAQVALDDMQKRLTAKRIAFSPDDGNKIVSAMKAAGLKKSDIVVVPLEWGYALEKPK
jgi:hypothetical protein